MACKAYRDLAYERGIKYPEMYVGFFWSLTVYVPKVVVFFFDPA